MSPLFAFLLSSSPAATLVAADRVELAARQVRLGEVAGWEGAEGLGEIVIARLPEGRAAIRLTRDELSSLIRRAVPGIRLEASSPGSILLVAPVKNPAPGRCLELMAARSAGEELLAGDVTPVSCTEAKPAAALRFDPATGANIVIRPLEAGTIIADAHLAAAPALRRGDRLMLSSTVGPVTIERPVTLAQGRRPSDRAIFVKTKDGEVFAAPLAGAPSQ